MLLKKGHQGEIAPGTIVTSNSEQTMTQRAAVRLLLGLSLLIGVPSSGWTQQVPRGQASFAQLRGNPQAYLGAAVVLGGEITRWTPSAQGLRLQVLQQPLGLGLRPKRLAFSGGLFWVEYPEELGLPSPLTPFITVIGEVVGTEQGHPLIRAQQAFLFSFWHSSYGEVGVPQPAAVTLAPPAAVVPPPPPVVSPAEVEAARQAAEETKRP